MSVRAVRMRAKKEINVIRTTCGERSFDETVSRAALVSRKWSTGASAMTTDLCQ
jgi:hypothetical protein